MKLLLYCTKGKWQLFKDIITGKWLIDKIKNRNVLNGKIIAECDFEVEEIYERVSLNDSWFNDFHHTKTIKNDELLKKSCLKFEEMNKYFDYPKNTLNKVGYAIHIKNLHIFDKPRELEYYHIKPYLICLLQNAPQNMCYCYEYRGMKRDAGEYVDIFEKHDLISIHPEWLCKILNGEKTIEVRKKVLKEILK